MATDNAPMEADSGTRRKVYGTLTVYGHCVTAALLIALSTGLVVHAFGQWRDGTVDITPDRFQFGPTYATDWLWFTLGFGVVIWLLPVFLVLMHSPRTRRSDIAVGTDEGIPALLLRQSRLIYNLTMFAVLPGLTVFMGFLLKIGVSTTDVSPVEEEIEPWGVAILLVFTFGYQAVIVVLIVLGRVRPGHIAIRHDGLHLRGYAHDAWIPWDSLFLVQPNGHWKFLAVWVGPSHHATFSSPIPLWKRFDNTVIKHGSLTDDLPFFVHVDRRPFRISPEIIDAAVEHYMENPDARRELRDPEAIARTVEVLRSHATTAWWRSQRRPVPVPRLVPGSTGRDEFLRKWSL